MRQKIIILKNQRNLDKFKKVTKIETDISKEEECFYLVRMELYSLFNNLPTEKWIQCIQCKR